MKKRFNIALLPTSQSKTIIQLAQQFSALADDYLLGEHSLPHLTLCHFTADDQYAGVIWEHACAVQKAAIKLNFQAFSCTVGKNHYWISLLPDQVDELHLLHRLILNKVKNPLNRSRHEYDPHMTLVNTHNKNYPNVVVEQKKKYHPIADKFILCLGLADEAWQLTHILKTQEECQN